jgi:hypothetical protein
MRFVFLNSRENKGKEREREREWGRDRVRYDDNQIDKKTERKNLSQLNVSFVNKPYAILCLQIFTRGHAFILPIVYNEKNEE